MSSIFDIVESLNHPYQGHFVYPDGQVEVRFKNSPYIKKYPEDYGDLADSVKLGHAIIIKDAVCEKGKELTHETTLAKIETDVSDRAKAKLEQLEPEKPGESK